MRSQLFMLCFCFLLLLFSLFFNFGFSLFSCFLVMGTSFNSIQDDFIGSACKVGTMEHSFHSVPHIDKCLPSQSH
jgi:hypothetical protein